MNLIFACWGHYVGFKDILACAVNRAGCPVYVISDGEGREMPGWADIRLFPKANAIMAKLEQHHPEKWRCRSLSRWVLLREFLASHKLDPPWVYSDWDVFWFRPMAESADLFESFDYLVSEAGCGSSAAYVVNNPAVLDDYCRILEDWMATKPLPWTWEFNDMNVWKAVSDTGRWKVGNMWPERDKSVFDHNIHVGEKEFQMDGPAKKVIYRNGDPYFLRHSGEEILARTIHCWGTYKTRTAEVRQKAGIQ